MARVQFTFTFTNAQPGAAVHFTPQTVKVYSSATDTTEDGPTLVLNSSNAVSVWSDAGILTAHTLDGRGEEIAATATHAAPTVTTDDGTAGSSPFGSGTSSPSAAGDVIAAHLPAGVEFAFWGYDSVDPGSLVAAFRVTTAGDYTAWGNEGDAALVAGFDLHLTAADADLAAMNVGEYVVLGLSSGSTAAQYATFLTFWGWDPQAALPGAWRPPIIQASSLIPYDHTVSALAATDVKAAIDELTARIVALGG